MRQKLETKPTRFGKYLRTITGSSTLPIPIPSKLNSEPKNSAVESQENALKRCPKMIIKTVSIRVFSTPKNLAGR